MAPIDPDTGPTPNRPSTQDQLEKAELTTRMLKLKFLQQQDRMIEEANAISRWDPDEQKEDE